MAAQPGTTAAHAGFFAAAEEGTSIERAALLAWGLESSESVRARARAEYEKLRREHNEILDGSYPEVVTATDAPRGRRVALVASPFRCST